MCKQCELKPVYEFTNQRKLCARCFVKWFQKKVLYTIRKFGMIKKDDVVCYGSTHQVGLKEGCTPRRCKTPKNIQKNIFTKGRNDFRGVVLEDVLKMFAEKAPVELIKGRGKETKIAINSTLDEGSQNIVESIINGKEKDLKKLKPVEGKVIKPLCLFLDKEVLIYANLRKLKFKKAKEKKNDIRKFVDVLESKHPEIKNAIVKGYLGLYN